MLHHKIKGKGRMTTHHRRLQEPPNTVRIELGAGGNTYKFMRAHTLRTLCSQMAQLRWNPRIELFGEPAMHPELIEFINIIRKEGLAWHVMIISSGSGLTTKPLARIRELFEVGINVLALDNSHGGAFIPRVRKAIEGKELGDHVYRFEYPKQPHGNPYQRVPGKRLVFVEDISKASEGAHAAIYNLNRASNTSNDNTVGRRCAKPFRELTVRWDGNVAVCCYDWKGVFKCGNILERGLNNVWNGPEMSAARVKLFHGQRDFGPCQGCTVVSPRVSMLPDRHGQVKVSLPNGTVDRDIKDACAGEPYEPHNTTAD